MTITPRDLGARLTENRLQQLKEERAAGIIKQEDIVLLIKLIRELLQLLQLLEVSEEASEEQKENVRQLVTEAGQRLKAIAAARTSDDPIGRIKEVWDSTFQINPRTGDQPRLGSLSKHRVRTVIDLAERVRRLLAAKCPEQVDVDETAATVVKKAATVVHQRDDHRLENLAAFLKAAAESPSLNFRSRRAIEAVVSKIWGRLLEEGEDPTLQELLDRWQDLYRLKSGRVEVDVQDLVRDKDDVARALVQETRKFLDSRRPDGA